MRSSRIIQRNVQACEEAKELKVWRPGQWETPVKAMWRIVIYIQESAEAGEDETDLKEVDMMKGERMFRALRMLNT